MAVDVGSGIREAADNFLKYYFIGQDRKRNEKLASIQPVVDAINARLQDKTLKLSDKAALLDQLQSVYKGAGISIKLPKGATLSGMILPQQLLDEEIETGEYETVEAVNAIPEDADPNDPANYSTTPIKLSKKVRRGDKSVAEIEAFLARRAGQAQDEDDISKRKRLMEIERQITQKALETSGYIKNPEEVVEEKSGRTWQVFTNPHSPDSKPKFIPLGNYTDERGHPIAAPRETTIPVSTYNARTRAIASAGGVSTTMKDLIFSVSQELGLPIDDEIVLQEAAKRYESYRQTKQKSIEAGGITAEQRAGGNLPIQPAEQERISQSQKEFEEQQTLRNENLQREADKAARVIASADSEISDLDSDIKEYSRQQSDLLVEGFEKTDKEYRELEDKKNAAKKAQREAKRRKADAEGDKEAAEKALQSRKSSTKSETKNATPEFSNMEKLAIAAFRRRNPKYNGKWNDQQVVDYLRRKGVLPKIAMNAK